MTLASIQVASQDEQLRRRIDACANREARNNPDLQNTQYAQKVTDGFPLTALYWGVAVSTEAAYYGALQQGRGAPGHDIDVITDADILSAVQANWPADPPTVIP